MLSFKQFIVEATVPYSAYGYWITPDGKYHPVKPYQHDDTAHNLVKSGKYQNIYADEYFVYFSTDDAITNGWIRVLGREGDSEIGLEFVASENTTKSALRSAVNLFTTIGYDVKSFFVDIYPTNTSSRVHKNFSELRTAVAYVNSFVSKAKINPIMKKAA